MRTFSILLLLFSLVSTARAQSSPEPETILKKMQLANQYFMDKWPDPGKTIITNRERPSNIWTRAVYYEGLMGLYSINPDTAYYRYAADWAEFHQWGFRSGNQTRNADDYCCAQTYIDLYTIDPKPERIANVFACMDHLLSLPESDADWSWIDAIQMGMPVLAKLGKMTGEEKYFRKMHSMYLYTRNEHGDNGLFNPKEGLWWRDADFDPPYTEPNGEDCYWSRGNGWVMMALARIMDITEGKTKNNRLYQNDFKKMAKALAKIQREDGTWNISLHDENHFGGMELSGTAMFTYGIAWGINQKILPRKKYLPIVEKAWLAMADVCLHENGFLGYVQGTGKEPKDGQPVGYDHARDFEDYALGAFLLAGMEMHRLKSK